MRDRWKANLWRIVLFPAVAGSIAVGYSLMQGSLHRWLGFDAQGRSVANGNQVNPPDASAVKSRSPISQRDVLETIRADLDRTETQQRPQRRYLTLVHRHNDPTIAEAELDLQRRVAADLATALSPPDRRAGLTSIDAQRLIFRLDLAQLGWSASQWRRLAVLYPYALNYDGSSDEALRKSSKAISIATGDRLSSMRADWFAVALSRPPLGGPGGTLGLRTKELPEKIQALVRDYAGQPIDLSRAACELGASVDALRRLLTEEAYLREEFGLALLLQGKTVPRDAWESDRTLNSPFQELSNCLGLGTPMHLR